MLRPSDERVREDRKKEQIRGGEGQVVIHTEEKQT